MKADQSILSWLDAPTKAPNWPVAVDGQCYAFSCMCAAYTFRLLLLGDI